MATRDLYSDIKVVNARDYDVISTSGTENGEVIDLKGFESCIFVIHNCVPADTGTLAVEVQESDASDSGWAAVADKDLIGSESDLGFAAHATNNDNGVSKIGYIGEKRYVRLNFDTGTATSAVVAVAIMGHPHEHPAD